MDARNAIRKWCSSCLFLKLLKEKPVNQNYGEGRFVRWRSFNRATFYAHYSDCFALMESIENNLNRCALRNPLRYVNLFI